MIHLNRTSATWTFNNPTLSTNHIGIESDTRKIKYGDGVTPWNLLAYSNLTYQETIVKISISDLQNSIPDFSVAYIIDNKQEGIFEYDSASTEAAVPGMIIITADSKRFKRVLNGSALNVLWLGADNTGNVDCAQLIRLARDYNTGKATNDGNSVYFPAGTYLTSCVDILSNSQFFGDGMGATIIKARRIGTALVKSIFGISTFPFDKSGHVVGDIINVAIHDLTLDFNFIDPVNPSLPKWVDFFCPIQFKSDTASSGSKIENVRIYNVQFIDNAKAVHGDIIGTGGKDAWCINFSASHIEHVWIENCISLAESHQFIAGGLSILKKIHVLNNHIEKPHANAITFTTVSQSDALFEDFIVSGNIINDPAASAILFGYDPSEDIRGVGYQRFSRLIVSNNHFFYGNYNVYGTDYRNNSSFPFLLNLSAPTPFLKDVMFTNNMIKIADDYVGNEIAMRLGNYIYNREPTTITADFKQPAVNGTVTIAVQSNTHAGLPAFTPEDHVTIYNGGLYEVVSSSGLSVIVKLIELGNYATPGSTIPPDSTITFIGGRLENITIVNNNVVRNGTTNVKVIPTGLVKKLIIKLNKGLSYKQNYSNTFIEDADISFNNDFALEKFDGYLDGVVQGNTMLKLASNNGVMVINNKVSPLTNMNEVSYVYAAFNVILDAKPTKTTGTIFKSSGPVPSSDVVLAFNNFRDTQNTGIGSPIKGLLNNYSGAVVQSYPAPISRDIIASKSWVPSFTSSDVSTTTLTVTGANIGDMVNLVVPLSVINDYVIYSAYVSAADIVTIKAVKLSGTPSLSTGSFEVKVTQK